MLLEGTSNTYIKFPQKRAKKEVKARQACSVRPNSAFSVRPLGHRLTIALHWCDYLTKIVVPEIKSLEQQ
jgi:hypothetical protein